MKIEKIYMVVNDFFNSFLNKQCEIIKISQNEDLWKVHVEVPEDKDYTRRFGKRDLKAVFEVMVDNQFNILSFEKFRVIEKGIPYDEEDPIIS